MNGPSDEILAPDATLGNYRIERRLGQGGMGAVYRAYDTVLHRTVALKVLTASLEAGDSRSRLLHEARSAARLNHPNICTIFEVGHDAGRPFIAMEFVEGRSLSERLKDGPLPPRDVIAFGIQAAEALAHAHDHGVVHRDFKTANAIVDPIGRLKVVDFGLARRADVGEEGGTTVATIVPAGSTAGTPYAMAPEQVRGEQADARTDVWALGVFLYELSTAARPFHGATTPDLFSAILRDAPAPIRTPVGDELRSIIQRSLSKASTQRYQSAREVAAALARVDSTVSGIEAETRMATPASRLRPAIAMLALIVLIGAAWRFGFLDRLSNLPGTAIPSGLAVLPFENLSGDPDQEYLASGLQEALITDLARVGLPITARASSSRFRGSTQAVSEIARTLHVDAVVTGSVTRSGNELRITAQLINAATERHLWADQFESTMNDVLMVQDQIVTAITRQVRQRLTPQDQARLAHPRPVKAEAYDAYLKGLFHMNQQTPASLKRGIALLEDAVTMDPTSPLPYAHLAVGYSTLGHSPTPLPDSFPRARAAAFKALQLDDTTAQAHAVLGEITMYASDRTWDWPAAERAFKRAVELNPSLAQAHAHYAWFLVLFDRWEQGFRSMRRAQQADPLTALWPAWQASLYWYSGRYDEAIREAKNALELNPNLPVAWSVLGRAYSDTGLHQEAIAAQEKAVALNSSFRWSLAYALARAGQMNEARKAAELNRVEQPATWGLALAYAGMGDLDAALTTLEAALEQGDGNLPWIRSLPQFRALTDSPRFQAILTRMRIPAYAPRKE